MVLLKVLLKVLLIINGSIKGCIKGSINGSIKGSINGSINVHMVCAICMLNTRICCLSFTIFVIFVRFVQDNPVSLSKHEKNTCDEVDTIIELVICPVMSSILAKSCHYQADVSDMRTTKM